MLFLRMNYSLNIYFILFILEVSPIRVEVYGIYENIFPKTTDLKHTSYNNNQYQKLKKFVPTRRKNVRLQTFLWPNGIMNYRFADNYPLEAKKKFTWPAMQDIEKVTCIRFHHVRDEELDKLKYVQIKNEGGCASTIGYLVDKKMQMNLNTNLCRKGHVIHELLHVLGFWHEHTRTDRDNKVKVLWKNIRKGKLNNFYSQKENRVQDLNLPYDYTSIMHYRSNSFTATGNKTLESTFEGAEQMMGQRNMLTMLDIAKINRLYDCKHNYRGTDLYAMPTRS